MTAKEWLMRAWRIDNEIAALEHARQRAYERCTSITSRPKDDVVQSGGADADAPLVTLVELECEIDRHIDLLVATKTEILTVIGKVDNSVFRTLLIERYLNFKTWERIAVDMNYSYRQIIYIHGSALLALAEKIA
ncbi:MAG: hypothetical protein RR142_06090 [Clostridia bacterium]